MTTAPVAIFTAEELMGEVFPETKYVIPGIIPEGMSVLVAAPKVGKSWLVLSTAISLSTGAKLLGGIENGRQRPVFYLALEDGKRRLQSRLRHMGFGGSPLLEFAIALNGNGVIKTITDWLEKHVDEEPVVFLDTLGKVMPPAQGNQTQYGHDYAVGSALKAACDAVPGSALVIVHHTNKRTTDDFVDGVSGTQGIAGSADSILELKRERLNNRATLNVTSRDAAEGSYELEFTENCVWELVGHSLEDARKAAEVAKITNGLGERMQDVIKVIADHPDGITAKDIKAKLPQVDNIDTYLKRAFESGRIARPQRGLYTPVTTVRSESLPSKETDTTYITNTPPLSDCSECGEALHATLISQGETVHPTCEVIANV